MMEMRMEARKRKAEEENLGVLAKNMFEPRGKEPYYKSSRAIRNFNELKENLERFTDKEAEWLASWIEYLGDAETARNIRSSTKNFKEIISRRYAQLKRHYHV